MFAQDTYDILAHLSDPDSSGSLQVAMAIPLWDLSEMGKRKTTSVPILSQKDSFNLIFLVFARQSTLLFLWLSMEQCVIKYIHIHTHTYTYTSVSYTSAPVH